MTTADVVVLGGGVGGSTLAAALRSSGHSVAVYEASRSSTRGHYLVLSGQALDELSSIGVDTATLVGGGSRVRAIRMITGGQTRTLSRDTDTDTGHGHLMVWRGDLMTVLGAAAGASARVVCGNRAVALDPGDGDVGVGFTDARDDCRAAVVIGCDGIDSMVRPYVADVAPVYAGQMVLYAHTTEPVDWVEPDVLHFFHGEIGTVGVLTTSTQTYWFARFTGPELTSGDDRGPSVPMRRWETRVAELGSAAGVPVIADLSDPTSTVSMITARRLEPIARWSVGRVAVIGDAAHGQSPAAGNGASTAIGDALAVAGELAALGTTPEALTTACEGRRMPYNRRLAALG